MPPLPTRLLPTEFPMITFALPLPVPLISSIPASVRFSKPEASVQLAFDIA